ncbi:MAG TPA: MFS transporter [Candidatus Binatia bacterium]|nr:MFS transporter [Candidatus Binatia bacterium]
MRGAFGRFLVLYALLYGAFGTSSPFLPRFFESRGCGPEAIGLVFGLGTAARLVSGPLAGRAADLLGAWRAVLACSLLAAAAVALGLLHAHPFTVLLAVGVAHAAALAPTTTLADALALAAAAPRWARFEYGWVRGAASGAFVAGSLVAGQVLRAAPLDAVVCMQAGLLAAAAAAVPLVPWHGCPPRPASAARAPVGGVAALLRLPPFRRLVAVAALVLGAHAMHDGFAMVRWNAAGIGSAASSVLWSESVVAEVAMFFLLGPALVTRLAPRGAMAVAALAGIVRWTVMAATTALPALALVQPLHGFTFALLHLACMREIAAVVPPALGATAQALYAVGATAMLALLTVGAGTLYARFGARGFLAMTLLCAVALPLALAPRGGARAVQPS